jgi:hypothetical protein
MRAGSAVRTGLPATRATTPAQGDCRYVPLRVPILGSYRCVTSHGVPAPRCRTRPFTLLTRRDDIPLGIVRFVSGGNHRLGHSRPAGLTRLREAIKSWLEETSFRTALAASATALLLIVAAVATALLVSGHGTAGGHGTVPDAAPSDPAGTAGTSGAMRTVSPQPRATAVPSATPASPEPASSPAAGSTASVANPSRSATSSPPRCPPGRARHHRCRA